MRTIYTHKLSQTDPGLSITALGAPGPGGDNHSYLIGGFTTFPGGVVSMISFQDGPVPENGLNGVTMEVLLAVVADRLACLQAGPFASDHNAKALAGVNQALEALHDRTRERQARGVEGSLQA